MLDGNAGEGVQVSTVLVASQLEVVAGGLNGFEGSMNCAIVAVVSIASLNVKTTAAVGETPVAPEAGTVETIVG